MLPDRVSNPGPLTYESGALPIALRGPALLLLVYFSSPEALLLIQKFLPEILIIWYVAMSSGPLPNLSKIVLSQRILGLQVTCT